MCVQGDSSSRVRRLAILAAFVVGAACFPQLGEYRSNGAGGAGGAGGAITSAAGGAGGSASETTTIVIGDAGPNELLAMAVDPGSGRIAVAGTFRDILDLGDGPLVAEDTRVGVFLAQYGPGGGTLDWSKRLVLYDPAVPTGNGLANVGLAYDVDGNLVAAGSFTGELDVGSAPVTNPNYADVFAVKLDPSGGEIWGHTFGDLNSSLARSVAVHPTTGDVLLTGQFNVNLDFLDGCLLGTSGNLDVDVFVALLDSADGHCLQAAQLGDSDVQLATSGAFAGDGVVLSGLFRGAINFAASGVSASAVDPRFDAFVVKLDLDLVPVFAAVVGTQDTGANGAVGVLPRTDGSVVYAGALQPPLSSPPTSPGYGGLDWVMGRLDAAGVAKEANVFGGGGLDAGFVVARPDGAGYRAFGSFELEGNFGGLSPVTANLRDGFVVDLDDDLVPLSLEQLGGIGDEGVQAIGFSGGDEVIAGTFTESIELGGNPHASAGTLDIFIHRRPFAPLSSQ